jgi:orotate phosphoribosyltransferase
MSRDLQSYQTVLIEHSMAVDALKFGSFTLKSGRQVPPWLASFDLTEIAM